MDIGYLWDEDKYRVVVEKHNVKFHEVVCAFSDPNGYESSDPSGHDDRWLWVGSTDKDRVLMVIYSEADLPLYRLITAFDAEGGWLDEYHKR